MQVQPALDSNDIVDTVCCQARCTCVVDSDVCRPILLCNRNERGVSTAILMTFLDEVPLL